MEPTFSISMKSFPRVSVGMFAERKVHIPLLHLINIYMSRELVMFERCLLARVYSFCSHRFPAPTLKDRGVKRTTRGSEPACQGVQSETPGEIRKVWKLQKSNLSNFSIKHTAVLVYFRSPFTFKASRYQAWDNWLATWFRCEGHIRTYVISIS